MHMKKLLLLGCLAFVGCQSDPYAGKPKLQPKAEPTPVEAQKPVAPATPTPEPTITPTPTPAPTPTPKPQFGLDVPDLMNFEEGSESSYFARGIVPAPGVANLKFENLPTGMVYKVAEQSLVWNPSYTAADDPADPSATARLYKIRAILTSSIDITFQAERDVLVIVKDKPQQFKFDTQVFDVSGDEGVEKILDIRWTDQDFPTQPHKVNFGGLPSGAEIYDLTPKGVKVKFKPTSDFVVRSREKISSYNVTVINPRGRQIDANGTWTVSNVYLPPRLFSPERVKHKGNLTVMVIAEDANGEASPNLAFLTVIPGGTKDFLVTDVPASASNPRARAIGYLTWSGVPATLAQKDFNLRFKTCDGANGLYCNEIDVKSFFDSPAPPTPNFDLLSLEFPDMTWQFSDVTKLMKMWNHSNCMETQGNNHIEKQLACEGLNGFVEANLGGEK